MMFEDHDDVLNERLRELAQDYHEPPKPPREAMWGVIAARRARPPGRLRSRVLHRPWAWGLAAAAVLTIGVGLGRWSMTRAPAGDMIAGTTTALPSDGSLGVAATQYLSRTEALLTAVRAGGPPLDEQFLASARELLTMTRLLLDSPFAASDPGLRDLLVDLELVLAQVAQLTPAVPDAAEIDLINDGLTERAVLPRLRTAIPAGPAAFRAQGDL